MFKCANPHGSKLCSAYKCILEDLLNTLQKCFKLYFVIKSFNDSHMSREQCKVCVVAF